jgi:3-phenylpropionate/cinnamic acid dioxygenase small subunit
VVDDARQIENLLYRYAEAIDAGDFDAVGALFARGRIVLDPANRRADVVGAEAVAALYGATTRRYPDGTPRTHHVTSNVRIDHDGGSEAEATSYFTVLQAIPEGGLALQPIVTGTYHDRFERHDDGRWWFAERRMNLRHIGDVSHHLLIDLGRTP